MAKQENLRMEILPPPSPPLEMPLQTKQVYDLLNISKSTLFRWEREGRIPMVYLDERKLFQLKRAYGTDDLINLLSFMQSQKHHYDQISRYPWLNEVDLKNPFTVTTPSGFRITLNPDQSNTTQPR